MSSDHCLSCLKAHQLQLTTWEGENDNWPTTTEKHTRYGDIIFIGTAYKLKQQQKKKEEKKKWRQTAVKDGGLCEHDSGEVILPTLAKVTIHNKHDVKSASVPPSNRRRQSTAIIKTGAPESGLKTFPFNVIITRLRCLLESVYWHGFAHLSFPHICPRCCVSSFLSPVPINNNTAKSNA